MPEQAYLGKGSTAGKGKRHAPSEVARTGPGGAKAIATRSRNSRAQDNVEQEQIKAGGEPAEYEERKAG